jgi:hypothetical protein
MTPITCQTDWVNHCQQRYRVDPPSGYHFENAHFPLSERLGGTETKLLWYPDHIVQGCLQTLNLGYPCIDVRKRSIEREIVLKEYPEYLELYDEAYKFCQTFAAKKLHEKEYELVCNSLAKGRETCREKKLGIYSLTPDERKENGKKGGAKGGGSTKRSVVCLETKVVYPSACHASEATGVNRGHIGECCRGKRKTAGGNRWKFATETN